MFALTQTTINNGTETIQTVDARQLHSALENGSRFRDWINRRIEEYGFEAGVDYVLVSRKFERNSEKGRPSTEYAIKIDMAKELCMLERSPKGRAVRKYFIECEKQLMQEHKARQGVQLELHKQILALEAQDKTTFQFASWGSKKMNERKKSIKAIRSERERLFKERRFSFFDAE